MPDFGYWSWPGPFMGEYSKLRAEIAANEMAWSKKKRQAVWRGATNTNELRNMLVNVTNGKRWSDVQAINWGDGTSLDEFGLSIPEHCDYQYALHTEGGFFLGFCLLLSAPCPTPLLTPSRPLLLRPRQVPPQLRLRIHSPHSRVDRAAHPSIRQRRPQPEYR
jgi:hypothetical protein